MRRYPFAARIVCGNMRQSFKAFVLFLWFHAILFYVAEILGVLSDTM